MKRCWMGQTIFNTEEEARQAFSILPEFKKEGNPLVLREYIVKQPIRVRKGIAGGLFSPTNGKSYSGGGIQIQLLDNVNYSPDWEKYFVKQDEVAEGVREYIKLLE